MNRLFQKITGQSKEYKSKHLKRNSCSQFQKADFTESVEPLNNPARGWYQIYNFYAEKPVDFKELEWSLDRKDRLALLVINIGYYREMDLDDTCIDNIKNILKVFEDAEYDVILRIVYDHEGKGLEREPNVFSQVKRHLEQIGEVFIEFPNTIFVYQGMLVGNWGEMHTTRHLKEERMEALADILKQRKSPQMYLAVRRPAQWRMLHKEENRQIEKPEDLMGLFDDGMFGSDSHLGTFGTEPGKACNWNEAWQKEDEISFEEKLCAFVPNGGEAVFKADYTSALKREMVENTLRKMHVTYLNRVHDKRILDIWKSWKCGEAGAFYQRSFYDYVGAHLGYRFWIKDASLTTILHKKDFFRLEVEIKNTGFANFYQENEISLEYIDALGERVSQKLDYDIRDINSGQSKRLVCLVPRFEGTLAFSLKRKWDGARIRLANQSDKEGRAILGTFILQEVEK